MIMHLEETSNPKTAKLYYSAFLVDETKLTKIINIIKSIQQDFDPKFEIFLNDGNELIFFNFEDVLNLDNTVRNPIHLLRITNNEKTRVRNVKVEYDICFISPESNSHYLDRGNIKLSVKCFDKRLALQIFDDLEVQIQRTFSRNFLYSNFVRNNFWFLTNLTMVTTFASFSMWAIISGLDTTSTNLTNEEIRRLISRLDGVSNLEEKVDLLIEVSKYELIKDLPLEVNFDLASIVNLQSFLLILPLLIVLTCVFYIARNCYPPGVFLWGDYKNHYNQVMSRRNTIWTVVIASILLGIITNLFVFVLSGFIS